MAPSNVNLTDLINLTSKKLERGSGNNLTEIKTPINERIEAKDDMFEVRFLPEIGDPIDMHVYDDYARGLVIELWQSGRLMKTETFSIKPVQCYVNFLFKPDVIWFFPALKSTIKLADKACDGWYLKVDVPFPISQWQPYLIKTVTA